MCNVYKYLVYFHHLQNLFDLTFFQCKLSAKAHSITGLEHSVLSGLPFWEDGEKDGPTSGGHDDLFDGESESDGVHEYSKQNDDVESETRNVLAMNIVKRIADEKKARTQLFRDLDIMKDKFEEISNMMRKQEHHLDLVGAANFLGEQVQINFNNIILVLMSVMDSQSVNSNS